MGTKTHISDNATQGVKRVLLLAESFPLTRAMKTLHFFAASWFVTLLGLASFCFAANPQSLDDRKINGQVIVADGTATCMDNDRDRTLES